MSRPPCAGKVSVKLRKSTTTRRTTATRLRKSTAVLMAAWVGTFVVYVFVKPADSPDVPTAILNAVPTWNNPDSTP